MECHPVDIWDLEKEKLELGRSIWLVFKIIEIYM